MKTTGTTVTLTPRQAEILGILTRAGGVSFKAQSARVKTVIRNLIGKGFVKLEGDAVRVINASAPVHYSFAAVMLAAVPLPGGDGQWKRAVLTLADGDTVYNPYSTKKVYQGAGEYVFMIHPSSVELTSMPGNTSVSYI
jgi:hypothetical protein